MSFIKKHVLHLFNAFRYSFQGLSYAFKHETAFQQETVGFLLSLPVLWLLDVPLFLKACTLFAYLFVLIAELANSAIEAAINRISEERHPLSGAAKDMGSAMVLLAFIPVISLWAAMLFLAFTL